MKFKLIIPIILFCQFYSLGQVDTTQIAFTANWSIGESYNFKSTEINQKWKTNKLFENDSSSYIVNFQVIDSTESDYKIKWSYKIDLNEFNIPSNLINKYSKYQPIEIIYKTNKKGGFLDFENWKEVSKKRNDFFAELLNDLSSGKKMSKKEIRKITKPISNVYKNKYSIKQELHIFHWLFGQEISLKEPYNFVEELSIALGDKLLRANSKIYLDSIDSQNSFCVIKKDMKLHPEDSRNMILELLRISDSDDEKIEMTEFQFDYQIKKVYQHYYYPGIPYMIEEKEEVIHQIGSAPLKYTKINRIELIK